MIQAQIKRNGKTYICLEFAGKENFLHENEYGAKYEPGDAHRFIIRGMEKVRKVTGENRHRKLTKHKNISNNTVIGIDHCFHLEILKLQKNLMRIAEGGRDRIRLREREA